MPKPRTPDSPFRYFDSLPKIIRMVAIPAPPRPAAPGEPAVQTRDRQQLEALSSENQSVRSRPKCCRKLFEEMKHGDETTEAALLVLSVISSMIMSAGFMRIFRIVVCNVHSPNVYATAL